MLKNLIVLTALLFATQSAFATQIMCPERYPNGARLKDGDVLRYQGGSRLKDGDVWRYANGSRLVDGLVWRYQNGSRLVDGDVWRYESGSRLLDGGVVRYESGSRLREPDGRFRSENGTVIGGDYFEHYFGTSDGTTVRAQFTKTTQDLTVIVENEGHLYELTYDKASTSGAPSKVKCLLAQHDDTQTRFSLNTKSAIVEVQVKSGHSPADVKRAIQSALDAI